MIDLKELREKVNGKNIPCVSVPKTLMLELLDRIEAAEKVCDAAVQKNLCYEGKKCTAFPEMLHENCFECPNKILCKALKQWQEVN